MIQTELLPSEKKYPKSPGYAKKRITSKQAADAIKNLSERQLAVYHALYKRPMTDHELAEDMGLDICQVQPRRSELEAMGRAIDSGDRRLTPYKRKAIVWQAV